MSAKTIFSQAVACLFLAFGVLSAEAKSVNGKYDCDRGRNLLLKTRDGFQVNFFRYGYNDAEEWNKLIVIVPPTGGVSQLDRSYATMFCRAGYVAIVLKSYTGSDEQSVEMAVHQRVIEKSVKAFRVIRAKYKQEFFGILGTSAGAIVSSTLVDDFAHDLDAIFTIVAGAPLHSVIARAGQKGLASLREKRMQEFGFRTVTEYETALAEKVRIRIPQNISPQIKVGMIVASKDSVVPSFYQETLRSWWKPQLLIRIKYGHTPTILLTAARHRRRILQFFNSAVSEHL
ncbi:MAG: hypothetical protein HRT45_17840 [Bdellovibrionales bacterium]|nr:hypothetical protein [Bdellovibrionales bacterium]